MEFADERVESDDGLFGLGSVRAELMSGMVYVRVVNRDEVGTGRLWFFKPSEDLVDAGVLVYFVVEFEIVGGALACYFGFLSGPEKTSGTHSLTLGQRPERNSAVPVAVRYCL